MAIPKRGEIWLADLGFVAKTRPVLVLNIPISNSDYALYSYSVVPHTTSTRDAVFNVTLSVPGLRQGTFNIQGLTAVSPFTFIRKIGELYSTQMELIEVGVKKWLRFE